MRRLLIETPRTRRRGQGSVTKVAIVTAAGRGIGEAVARELASRGYALALMSITPAADALARQLGGIGFTGSVAKSADLEHLVAGTLDRFGRIDAVVNNSSRYAGALTQHGIGARGRVTAEAVSYDPEGLSEILDIPDQGWHDLLDLIFLNVVRMCRLVTGPMIGAGGGAIVNISGVEAVQPFVILPGSPIRLALHGFTKHYADRYGRDGIRMNSVLPGFLENIEVDEREILRAIPLARLGKTSEIAKTVAFLLSEDAGYISGQSILADGALARGI
jgi:NAD(P)-dependent dehydrogenase (short-subunit alcohol dehydrogenase family)